MQCVGATTLDEYRKYIEKDPALKRRFQTVDVPEPSIEDTIEILKGLCPKYATHHNVHYTDQALIAAARLSKQYIRFVNCLGLISHHNNINNSKLILFASLMQ